MNDRIKELIKQHGINITIDGLGYGEGNVERLAELIIKETLQVARAGIEFGDGMEDAVYKYFGVEE